MKLIGLIISGIFMTAVGLIAMVLLVPMCFVMAAVEMARIKITGADD